MSAFKKLVYQTQSNAKTMKKHSVFIIMLIAVICGCQNKNQALVRQSVADTAFYTMSEEFLSGYFSWRPGFAAYLGLHEYDGKVSDLSSSSVGQELARLNLYEQKLTASDTTYLSSSAYYGLPDAALGHTV